MLSTQIRLTYVGWWKARGVELSCSPLNVAALAGEEVVRAVVPRVDYTHVLDVARPGVHVEHAVHPICSVPDTFMYTILVTNTI